MRMCSCLIFAMLMLTGCRPAEVGQIADIDSTGWNARDTARIELRNEDTTGLRDLRLLMRFDRNLLVREIPLRVRVENPDSIWYEESFTAHIAPISHQTRDPKEIAIAYRNKVILSRKGTYVFKITTLADGVPGVRGIGIESVPHPTDINGQE